MAIKEDRELMTQLAHSTNILRELTDNESLKLKNVLLKMLNDILSLCNKHNIDIILVGGSALGAIRHKGFIPWDDDLDLGLSRADYTKLIKLIESGALGSKYEFTYPNNKTDSKNLFLKIFLKGSKNVEITDITSPFPKGIFVDIFPIDYALPPGWKNKIKGFISNIWAYLSVSVLFYQYPNKEYENFMCSNNESAKRFRIRKLLGKLGSIIPHRLWAYHYDSFIQHKKTDFLTIPSGRKHYSGETLNANIFFPSKKAVFEGIQVNVPNNIDAYLKNLYGHYMDIPPIEKRERHYVIDFMVND